ncbi:ANKRD50 [Symbiodinium necroappetens]|uniref:ANKRD50 protein n=1 Tax=Symbiodinium necroappetens TaxID=1628268 RepID=A0A812UHR2_9DINO|nr:ANKRD50 [Symbiodinium necroappetens]
MTSCSGQRFAFECQPPSCFPLEQFGLGDSKYDEKIDLLRLEDGAEAKYAKALEISGGEEKLRSFQDLSKELQRKHGLHEEQKGIIETGEREFSALFSNIG